jgi:curli biogenesis system outer membrane secretion channel CsgG
VIRTVRLSKKFINITKLILTGVAFFVQNSYAQTSNIAVLNFTARNVTEVEAQVVSDRLRIAMKITGKFTIIERNLMDKLLNEQRFQQSGCVESGCMVEVGKLLSVKQIVGGSVSRVGSQLVVEAKLVDVQTGEILKNVIKDYTGPYEMLLSQVVPAVASELSQEESLETTKPKKNIALMEFVARGLSETEAAIISDRIRLELKNTGVFNVIEREMMNAILKEQSFQQSGCTESECLVEVGQLLAVEKMVGGSISKVGNLFVIEARIIDVKTGSIDYNVAEDYSGPIELLLVNVTKKVAQRLAGQEPAAPTVTTPVYAGQADLIVNSTPAGGVIYFDGAPLNKMTPSTFQGMPTGQHKIKVEKGELFAEETVVLIDRKLSTVNLVLKEKTYSLIIYSNPSGATVRVGTRIIGQTPKEYTFKRAEAPFEVIILKDGFYPDTSRIAGELQPVSRIDAQLEPGGVININTNPAADVYLNGKKRATTPYRSGMIKFGKYDFELRRVSYQPISFSVELSAARPVVNISKDLSLLYGELAFAIQPAGATVLVDHQPVATSPGKNFKVPYGVHQIQVKKQGFYTHTSDFNLDNSKVQNIEVKLPMKSKGKARLLSIFVPGSGQIYYGTYGKGLVIGGITVGLVYGTYYFNAEFSRSWDQFNIDLANYRKATTVAEIKRTRQVKDDSYATALKNRNFTLYSMGALGLVWLYNIWDSGHNFKGISRNIEMSSGESGLLQLSYRF